MDTYLFETFGKLTDFEKTKKAATPKSPAKASTGKTSAASSVSAKVNLPKLNIQPFDGNIQKYTTFIEQFNISIDSKPFDDVQKLAYLVSLLIGTAAQSIEGLSITSSNYPIALDILKNRFGSTQKIINSHICALKDIQSPSHSTASMQSFHDQFTMHMRVLETHGVKKDSYSVCLLYTSPSPRD